MGVGLAGMWYRFGKSGSLRVETRAELARDGHFIIYCSAPDYGQGIATVMVQLAAEALGVSKWGILMRHVVPNLLGPVVIYMTLLVPQVIILESFLSFLGLGVQEPMSSWGVLISQGAKNIPGANWLLVFPSIFLTSTLFALNFIGDGLRDALDPKDR